MNEGYEFLINRILKDLRKLQIEIEYDMQRVTDGEKIEMYTENRQSTKEEIFFFLQGRLYENLKLEVYLERILDDVQTIQKRN